jgi:4-alpha-glucanotransferase
VKAHWQSIGHRPHHGICLPLFAIHTKNGPATFLDLIPLIDWCHSLGLDCIQLLPLNDSGSDPSPYNPISSCALNPRYLAPHSNTPPPQSFLDQNPWLLPYAQFKAYKARFQDKNWTDWPTPLPSLTPFELEPHITAQYHAFQQLAQVHAHATKKGVFLIGDVPILVSPDSADVWANPHLFHLNIAAGAPPDYYNQLGQYWGFPLFNWDAMRKTHFAWWKLRLKVAERLFHIYRIDHVVGFFRIWGIPKGQKPTKGSFYPPDPSLWTAHGTELLNMMLDATTLLPIAEDLGTIPPEVYPILKNLGICGTKVIRWQKHDGHFIPYSDYEPLSLTTVSTPDMPGLTLWWKQYPSEAVPFAAFKHWAYHPLLSHDQLFEILRDSHHTASIFHINPLQEYLALFPSLAWPNPEQDRINKPGTLLPTNWTYHFRPTLEELLAHEGLKEAFRKILS